MEEINYEFINGELKLSDTVKPGGATVVILNDNVTPVEVVIEAIMAATSLSESEAYQKMITAHTGGWSAIKSYPSVDQAETVATNIQVHAENNTRYDHYRASSNHKGPWPLTTDVMDIG